jgi:hypothetical protein
MHGTTIKILADVLVQLVLVRGKEFYFGLSVREILAALLLYGITSH